MAVGAILQSVARAHVAQGLLTHQGDLLSLNEGVVDAGEIIQHRHLHATHQIVHRRNEIHGQRQIVIHRHALEEGLYGIFGVAASDLIVVIFYVVVGKGNLLGIRGDHRRTADGQLIDSGHRVAVDVQSGALLILVVENKQHQKIRLHATPVGVGDVGIRIPVQTQNQEGFDILLTDVLLSVVGDDAVEGVGGRESIAASLPQFQEQESGGYETHDQQNNRRIFQVLFRDLHILTAAFSLLSVL